MKNEKVKFWIRFAIWALLAGVFPVVFIAWRFELFSGNKVSLSGFGVLAIIIGAIFFISLLRYVCKGVPHSMFTQCVSGFCKITLPLMALLGIVVCVKNSTENFITVLCFVIISETCAIPINPMPEWAYNNAKEKGKENASDLADILIEKVFAKKKGSK